MAESVSRKTPRRLPKAIRYSRYSAPTTASSPISTDRPVRGITVLGKYDPLMLSYSDKTWICDERRIPIIWTRAARVQAVIVRRNRIIGFWQQRQKDSVYEVSLFRDIAEKDEESISKRLERISGFLGKTYKGTEFSVVR